MPKKGWWEMVVKTMNHMDLDFKWWLGLKLRGRSELALGVAGMNEIESPGEVRFPRASIQRNYQFFLYQRLCPHPASRSVIIAPSFKGMIMASPPCTGPAERAALLWLRC